MIDHDYREFYSKDYLGSWDIPESGEWTVTIVKCVQGELNNPGTKKKTKKPVVFIQESEKQFALNATNGKTIAALYGNKVSGWVGKRITLFKSMTRNPAGGDDVECLRIRPKVPASNNQRARQPEAATSSLSSERVTVAQAGESTNQPAAQPGQANSSAAPLESAPAGRAALISPEQVVELERLCNDAGIDVEDLKRKGKVKRLALLEAHRYDGCVAWIKAAAEAKGEVS